MRVCLGKTIVAGDDVLSWYYYFTIYFTISRPAHRIVVCYLRVNCKAGTGITTSVPYRNAFRIVKLKKTVAGWPFNWLCHCAQPLLPVQVWVNCPYRYLRKLKSWKIQIELIRRNYNLDKDFQLKSKLEFWFFLYIVFTKFRLRRTGLNDFCTFSCDTLRKGQLQRQCVHRPWDRGQGLHGD